MKYLFLCAVMVSQSVFAQPAVNMSLKSFMVSQPLGAGLGNRVDLAGNESPGLDEQKSVAAAAFYSLLLPGMGELYVGDYSAGKYFTIAEASLWVVWTGFQSYGSWVQADAHEFAAQHAGVNPADKEDEYFVNIGNFRSVYAFNQEMLRERNQFKTYNVGPSYYWNWDTDANRERFREMRVSSDETFNTSRYVIAAILVNHVASAINAARRAISHNRDSDQSETLNIHASLMGEAQRTTGIVITFSKSF